MIKEIHLKNFKCFQDETLDVKPLTLLTGVNGMGKSTFLQSLLTMRQSVLQNLLPKTGLLLNGDLVKLGNAKDILFEQAEKEEIEIDLKFDGDCFGKFKFGYNQTNDVLPINSKDASPKIYDENLFTDNFHYLSSERIGPRPTYEMSDFQVVQHKQLGVLGQHAIHFLSVYGGDPLKISALQFPGVSIDTLKDSVEGWLGIISPGTRIVLTPQPSIGHVTLEYAFVRGKGSPASKNHRPTNVGFGITFILPVLVAILSAEAGSILLIENPEAHLHPRGQFMLGRLMAIAAGNGVQIIVESHSDHFLNGVRVATKENLINSTDVSINYFDFDEKSRGSKITKIKVDSNGSIDNWPDGFFDEIEKSLARLM